MRTCTDTRARHSLLSCTVDPGAWSKIKVILLIQAGERDKYGTKIQRENYRETTITSAFTLIISLLNTRKTHVAQKLLPIHP